MSESARLHYIFDPLCGWCYAAAPLLRAVREAGFLPITFHGGGMLTGSHRRPVTAEFRRFVMGHAQRIHQMTGQPFGEAYLNGLLQDTRVVFDSTPPTIAILAAETLGGRGLDLLAAIQQAHFVDGRDISQGQELTAIALALGLDGEAFQSAWNKATSQVESHFEDSRRWLTRAGGQGFPTFALEQAGRLLRVDMGPWLGQPGAFVEALKAAMETIPAGSRA